MTQLHIQPIPTCAIMSSVTLCTYYGQVVVPLESGHPVVCCTLKPRYNKVTPYMKSQFYPKICYKGLFLTLYLVQEHFLFTSL